MVASDDAQEVPGRGAAREIADALRDRASEVSEQVVQRWRGLASAPVADVAVEAGIRRSTRAGITAVTDYLRAGDAGVGGAGTQPLLRHSWAAMGGIRLSEVTKLYLNWREVCGGIVREEARRLGATRDVLDQCLSAVDLVSDVGIVRMARRFEVTRLELEEQLAENRVRLEHQALHDPLTGLANRVLLLDRLEHAIGAMARRALTPTVLFMDLDCFKSVNDASGHSAGDQLLVDVAARLQAAVRPGDTVARLGGDEFVVLCEDLEDPLAEGVAAARRISRLLDEPFEVAGRQVVVAASVGVAPAGPRDGAEELIARADQAMYRAKQLGRGRIEVYDPGSDRHATRHAELSAALHGAMANRQLDVAYQAVVDLPDRRVVAREALLRWRHPRLGSVPPSELVPVAEQTDLIVAIGRWVLRRACDDCARWRASGEAEIGVAVNVSGRQLESPHFGDDVAGALGASGLAPEVLTLEVTEQALMAGGSGARTALGRIRETGVRIAIDDFGVGYSGLPWLARLPLDALKIDRSFVATLGLVERTTPVVEAMVRLAHALGLEAVAKGVETDEQLDQLTRLGCDAAQGYLLGYPVPLGPAAIDDLRLHPAAGELRR